MTRRPSTICGDSPSRCWSSPACGPPPCTITNRHPARSSATTSASTRPSATASATTSPPSFRTARTPRAWSMGAPCRRRSWPECRPPQPGVLGQLPHVVHDLHRLTRAALGQIIERDRHRKEHPSSATAQERSANMLPLTAATSAPRPSRPRHRTSDLPSNGTKTSCRPRDP